MDSTDAQNTAQLVFVRLTTHTVYFSVMESGDVMAGFGDVTQMMASVSVMWRK
jgi:hypothetical protein